MKLHFESKLDYQWQAIEAVCDLFRGQEVCRTEFTVTLKAPAAIADDSFPGTVPQQMTLGMAESDLGIGNRLTLLDDELHQNLADIQLRGGLPPSSTLASGDFTVEMETGTGKTYQLEHSDHGGDGRCHQQEGRQQPLQGDRKDRWRETHRSDQGDAAQSPTTMARLLPASNLMWPLPTG